MELDCPFVYANGKRCKGKIVRVKVWHCTVEWDVVDDEVIIDPGTHVHLYCSEKGDHAGWARKPKWPMRSWAHELPDYIKEELRKRGICC